MRNGDGVTVGSRVANLAVCRCGREEVDSGAVIARLGVVAPFFRRRGLVVVDVPLAFAPARVRRRSRRRDAGRSLAGRRAVKKEGRELARATQRTAGRNRHDRRDDSKHSPHGTQPGMTAVFLNPVSFLIGRARTKR